MAPEHRIERRMPVFGTSDAAPVNWIALGPSGRTTIRRCQVLHGGQGEVEPTLAPRRANASARISHGDLVLQDGPLRGKHE